MASASRKESAVVSCDGNAVVSDVAHSAVSRRLNFMSVVR
jgi:hypothetical protein